MLQFLQVSLTPDSFGACPPSAGVRRLGRGYVGGGPRRRHWDRHSTRCRRRCRPCDVRSTRPLKACLQQLTPATCWAPVLRTRNASAYTLCRCGCGSWRRCTSSREEGRPGQGQEGGGHRGEGRGETTERCCNFRQTQHLLPCCKSDPWLGAGMATAAAGIAGGKALEG